MAYLSRNWYVKGQRARESGHYRDMYAAWRAAKPKPKTPGLRVDAQESFFVGWKDAREKNPMKIAAKDLRRAIPSKYIPAKIRRDPKTGRIKVQIQPGKLKKTAKAIKAVVTKKKTRKRR